MVTSLTSDLLMRSWDMQLKASVGNLHITDHYITGKHIHTCAVYILYTTFTVFVMCVCVCVCVSLSVCVCVCVCYVLCVSATNRA